MLFLGSSVADYYRVSWGYHYGAPSLTVPLICEVDRDVWLGNSFDGAPLLCGR